MKKDILNVYGPSSVSLTNTTWDLENGVGIIGCLEGEALKRFHFIGAYWFVRADYYP